MQSFDYQLPLANDMETSFYHDNQREAVKKMKSSMSLDFGAPSQKKRATQTTQHLQPGILGSPDLNMLKLASPELERMIIQQNGMVTTTPTPTQFTNPKFVTEEQEAYARGFVDALAELHEKQGVDGCPQPMDDSMSVSTAGPVTSMTAMTTLMPSSMAMSDIPSSTTMINTVAPVCSTVMSTAGYQTHTGQQQQGIMSMNSMNYSTADQIMTTSVPTTCADMMPVTSQQQQYTTLLPPSSQHQQQQNTYNNLPAVQENNRVMQLKQEEPQTVPNLGLSPPLSPIDMASQERIKLERKRERNRVAARKCRTRKLERISRLEDRVSELKGQNGDLVSTATQLREQVCKLKSQILQHVKSGCQVMMSQNLL